MDSSRSTNDLSGDMRDFDVIDLDPFAVVNSVAAGIAHHHATGHNGGGYDIAGSEDRP